MLTGRRMIVFVHVPKTAGSTFNFILENSIYPCAYSSV